MKLEKVVFNADHPSTVNTFGDSIKRPKLSTMLMGTSIDKA
jgi:hypothetical protein